MGLHLPALMDSAVRGEKEGKAPVLLFDGEDQKEKKRKGRGGTAERRWYPRLIMAMKQEKKRGKEGCIRLSRFLTLRERKEGKEGKRETPSKAVWRCSCAENIPKKKKEEKR